MDTYLECFTLQRLIDNKHRVRGEFKNHTQEEGNSSYYYYYSLSFFCPSNYSFEFAHRKSYTTIFTIIYLFIYTIYLHYLFTLFIYTVYILTKT